MPHQPQGQDNTEHPDAIIDIPAENRASENDSQVSHGSSWGESARYFFGDVLNPRDYFSPMNTKRLMVWFFGALSLFGLIVFLLRYDGIEILQGFLSEEIILLSVLVYGMEPLKRFLAASMSRFPSIEERPLRALTTHDDEHEEENETRLSAEERAYLEKLQKLSDITGESVATLKLRYKANKKLMVMIPCYKSMSKVGEKRLHEVITSALKQVPPENIYLVDNGKESQPTDNTKEAVLRLHPELNYQYFPYPGKTTALMKAVVDVLADKPHLKYVLTFDNDVTVPDHYQFRKELFDDKKVKAVVYPIRAVGPDGEEKNLLTQWQDIDYVFSGANKSYLDHFGSLDKPHGAVSCWEIKTLYEILRLHNGQFRGEDWQLGILLKTLYSTNGVLKARLDGTCFFKTDAPQKYFAADGRWPQQVRSWMVVPYLWPWKYVLKPFFGMWRTNTFGELLTMKFEQFYEAWSLFSTVLHYPLMALQANNPSFWMAYGAIKTADLAAVLIANYKFLPKYLRNDLKAILTYPIHKQIDTILQLCAFLRTVLIEVPNDEKHPSIQELMDDGTLPSFNTDNDSQIVARAEANLRRAPSDSSEVLRIARIFDLMHHHGNVSQPEATASPRNTRVYPAQNSAPYHYRQGREPRHLSSIARVNDYPLSTEGGYYGPSSTEVKKVPKKTHQIYDVLWPSDQGSHSRASSSRASASGQSSSTTTYDEQRPLSIGFFEQEGHQQQTRPPADTATRPATRPVRVKRPAPAVTCSVKL